MMDLETVKVTRAVLPRICLVEEEGVCIMDLHGFLPGNGADSRGEEELGCGAPGLHQGKISHKQDINQATQTQNNMAAPSGRSLNTFLYRIGINKKKN
jgi:hypothetical protein